MTKQILKFLRENRQWTFVGAFLLVALLFTLWLVVAGPERKTNEIRPRLAYMSSVPLAFGNGDIGASLSGDGEADAFYQLLQGNYELQPVDDLGRLGALRPDVLLLLQPRGLSAAENVALDNWLRAGGKLLMFTDPALVRDSAYPLGDHRRPMFTSLASPLLRHWGVELVLPVDEAEQTQTVSIDGKEVTTAAPGRFRYIDGQSSEIAACRLADDGMIARCQIGDGSAILLPDADMANPAIWPAGGLLGTDSEIEELSLSWLEELRAK